MPPESRKKEKHDIPDPADWLAQHSGGANGPENAGKHTGGHHKGHSNPNTPGEHGSSGSHGPTKESGNQQGWGGIKGGKTPKGNQAQSKSRGAGKLGLAPNNKKKADSMVKGKPAYGLPSRDSMVRRMHPTFNTNSPRQPSRSGVMSKFEGFTPAKQ